MRKTVRSRDFVPNFTSLQDILTHHITSVACSLERPILYLQFARLDILLALLVTELRLVYCEPVTGKNYHLYFTFK